jgi:hypothetical protein
MARGGRRAGAGRKPKPLSELQLTGGFRTTRHAHLLKPVFPAAGGAWTPDPALLAAQGAAGRAFVERIVAANELTDHEGELVLELGHVVTALSAVRAFSRDGLSLKERGQRDRIELGWVRAFASLMALLRITP